MREFEEIELLLRKTCFLVKVAGRMVLKDFELTASQFDILQYLYFEGPQRMTKLSEKMGVTKSTMTGLVARLENCGYVTRERYERDRRVFLVKILPKGEKIIRRVIEKRVDFIASSLLNEVNAETFLDNLKKVYGAISKRFDQLKS